MHSLCGYVRAQIKKERIFLKSLEIVDVVVVVPVFRKHSPDICFGYISQISVKFRSKNDDNPMYNETQ